MKMGGLLTPIFDTVTWLLSFLKIDIEPSNMRIKINNTNRVFVKTDMGHWTILELTWKLQKHVQ